MKLPLAISVTLVLGVVPAVSAQHHTTGWIFTCPGSAILVGRIDATGQITTLIPQTIYPLEYYRGGTMDFDNRTYVLAHNFPPGSLVWLDSKGTVLRSLTLSTVPKSILNDVVLDSDGNLIAVEEGNPELQNRFTLYKVGTSGTATTLITGDFLDLPRELVLDADTGDLIVVDAACIVARIPSDGSRVLPILFSTSMRQITQDLRSGDYFAGSPQEVMFRLSPTGRLTTVLRTNTNGGLNGGYATHADRSSAASPRLAFTSQYMPSRGDGFFLMDLQTKTVTTLTRNMPGIARHIFPDRGRNVATLKRGPGRWLVHLSFPGEGGNNYLAALSASGLRPGAILPDGRRVGINIDPLTLLSIHGALHPLFSANVGILSATGDAYAHLDVSGLPFLRGQRLWIQGLTLDPLAPLGIRTIADPVLLVL